MSEIYLRNIFRVTAIKKRTTAQAFKGVKVDDTVVIEAVIYDGKSTIEPLRQYKIYINGRERGVIKPAVLRQLIHNTLELKEI